MIVGVAALVGAEDTEEAEADTTDGDATADDEPTANDADVAVSWRLCAPGGRGTVDIGIEAITVSLDCTTI